MTVHPEYTEAIQLLFRAMRAPEDVSEVSSDGGRAARIDRSPEPGIDVAIRIEDLGWLALSTTPVPDRPAAYPNEIPFVPEYPATVVVLPEQVTVTWRGTEGFVCPAPQGADQELLKNLADQMRPFEEGMKKGDATATAEGGKRIREFMESLDAEARQQFLASMMPDPELMSKLQPVFEAACEQSAAQGWREVERKERTAPVVAASVTYERDRLQRDIALVPLGGAPQVMLRQYLKESREKEPP